MLLIRKKIPKVEYYQKKINKELDNLSHKLKLTHAKSLEDKEIKKSFIKGLIRYSNTTKQILDIILKEINFKKTFGQRINYITIPYPMLHLPNDILEIGGFHNDQIGKLNMFTCWTPLTYYKYPALSRSFITSKYFNFINIFFKKIKFLNIFSFKMNANFGEIFFWNAKIFHKGNLNNSKNFTCAFQFKITEEPFLLENSFKIKNKKINYETINHDKNMLYFKKYVKFLSLLKFNKINKIEHLYDFIQKNKFKKKSHIAFALSVFSQRLTFAKTKKIKINYTNHQIFLLDYMSFLLNGDNLISVKRLYFYIILKNDTSLLKKFKNDLKKSHLTNKKLNFLLN